mgnify:CR=1 FL=1
MQSFDVVIVGAGAAGLFCAGVAGQRGLKVLLIDHADKLAEKIMKGSSGVWGQVPMPAQPALKDEDARVLARWIVAGAR